MRTAILAILLLCCAWSASARTLALASGTRVHLEADGFALEVSGVDSAGAPRMAVPVFRNSSDGHDEMTLPLRGVTPGRHVFVVRSLFPERFKALEVRPAKRGSGAGRARTFDESAVVLSVPLPPAALLLLGGFAGLVFFRKRVL